MITDDMSTRLEQQIPALRRYAFALLRDHDGADDLVQDCLERALARLHLRRDDGNLRAWLFTILRNLYINAHRNRKRRGTHVEIDAFAQSLPADADNSLEAREALSALDQLPEEQKSLLLLIGVEDFSYEEAAQALGLPIGTIMSRLSRARQRLRTIIETGRPAFLRRVK